MNKASGTVYGQSGLYISAHIQDDSQLATISNEDVRNGHNQSSIPKMNEESPDTSPGSGTSVSCANPWTVKEDKQLESQISAGVPKSGLKIGKRSFQSFKYRLKVLSYLSTSKKDENRRKRELWTEEEDEELWKHLQGN